MRHFLRDIFSKMPRQVTNEAPPLEVPHLDPPNGAFDWYGIYKCLNMLDLMGHLLKCLIWIPLLGHSVDRAFKGVSKKWV